MKLELDTPERPLNARIVVRVTNPTPEADAPQDTAEHRTEVRQKTLKGGQALYKGHNCSFECLVYDISGKGARIRLKDPFKVPEAFTLKLSTGETHHCAVVWQAADKIGVEFT